MSSRESAVEIETEIRRQTELLDARRAAYLAADGAATRCKSLLTMVPVGKVLVDAPPLPVKPRANGSLREAVERTRVEIGQVKKSLRNAQTAPLPVADRKK
jgi:hypothetical protein